MKTLYEGILDDIDSTLDLGDKLINVDKELHTIYKFKQSRWTNIYNGPHPNPMYSESIDSVHIYKYIWDCPGVLHTEKIRKLIGTDAYKVAFILYLEQGKTSHGTKVCRPSIDLAFLDKDNNIICVYQQYFESDVLSDSKTRVLSRVSSFYMQTVDEDELINVLKFKRPDKLYNNEYKKVISFANLLK